MMEPGAVVELLLHGNQLKRTARTGWVQRGLPEAENVAAHSYGVAFAVLVLSTLLEEPLDLGRALAMAILHDLPEGLTSDIPTPSWRYLPQGAKIEVERSAMGDILDGADFASGLLALWEELNAAESIEARLVHDADKIDMFLQALVYQEQTGNRHLGEFWAVPAKLNLPQSQALYGELRARWIALQGDAGR
jgi:putative hydrolase of HD superfamily